MHFPTLNLSQQMLLETITTTIAGTQMNLNWSAVKYSTYRIARINVFHERFQLAKSFLQKFAIIPLLPKVDGWPVCQATFARFVQHDLRFADVLCGNTKNIILAYKKICLKTTKIQLREWRKCHASMIFTADLPDDWFIFEVC